MYDSSILILCGGRGSRLAKAWSSPKILAPVGDEIYLEILLKQIDSASTGLNVVLATGVKSHEIEEYVAAKNLDISICKEDQELGTGGALLHFLESSRCARVTVINGDTLYNPRDLTKYLLLARATDKNVVSTVRVGSNDRFGYLDFSDGVKILRSTSCRYDDLVFPGLLTINTDRISGFSLEKRSLEAVFNALNLSEESVHIFELTGGFHDIGTPLALEAAAEWVRKN